jgi:hypothetical protein
MDSMLTPWSRWGVDKDGQGVDREWTRSGQGVDKDGQGVDREWTRSGQGVDKEWARTPWSGQGLLGVHKDLWGSVNYTHLDTSGNQII